MMKIKTIDTPYNSFIYANAKPNGICSFINCSIEIPDYITILDGYPIYIEYINYFTINFNNSNLPTNAILISDLFINNTNIKINIIK